MSTTPLRSRAGLVDTVGVLSALAGLLMSLLAVVVTPAAAFGAEAATEPTCEMFGVSPPGGGFYRTGEHVVIEADTSAFAGGTAVIVDDNTVDPSEHPANRMLVEVDGEQVFEPFAYEIGPSITSPEFVVGQRLTVTLQVERVTSIQSLTLCLTAPEPEPEPEPTPEPTPSPQPEPAPSPEVSLVKDSVVGGGSDLVDGGEDNDFLSWAEDDTDDQTARYRYTFTNTGTEPLIDLELVDDRSAIGMIDLSGCPDVLAVDEACTVFADESFARPETADQVTNTGTVTGTGEDSGETVSADDPATIDLVGVLPRVIDAIEIDLVKSVVPGAGDVDDAGVVTWTQDDFEAGIAKTVVYRFEVTNVGEAPIVDVELTDPMLGAEPVIAVEDGVTLEPGESTVVEVEHSLTVEEAFPDGEPTASRIDNVAEVTGANSTRDAFSDDSDDASVTIQVVSDEVVELPTAGLQTGVLLPLGLLLTALGAAILGMERRRRPAS